MRVTAETKEATRKAILDAAAELFRSEGFEATTTRDIAEGAGVASGTLFNYFPTKEAVLATLVSDALSRRGKKRAEEQHASLEEALFAHAAESLRLLKPYRKHLRALLETALSPLSNGDGDEEGASLRTGHLERVMELSRRHKVDGGMTPTVLQMYWSLYLGVLAFWMNDGSRKQEETLALLDQSMEMFAGWLKIGNEG